MRKQLFVALLALMVCAVSGFAEETKEFGFKDLNEAKKEIEDYYKERQVGRMISRIYILEIVKAEKDCQVMYVYFTEKNPSTHKDFYGNIYSKKVPVKVAIYNYSYLKNSWRLKTIEDVTEDMVFKID